MRAPPLVTRHPTRLVADPSRVIAQLFVPGHYRPDPDETRATGVVAHILDLADGDVAAALASVMRRFDGRHRDLLETFRHHADRIGNRLQPDATLSEARWALLGATFTHEYAVEAAALCNPSAVPAPDQSGVPSGGLRFVMSVRQIGEGHRSSIGFRTGILDSGGVSVDAPARFTSAGKTGGGDLRADTFRNLAQGSRVDTDATRWVLDGLDSRFTIGELEARLVDLEDQKDTRRDVAVTVRRMRQLAARSYTAQFAASSDLSERVLYPATSVESNGMEDARFIRFINDDGTVTYHATYTAFDGSSIVQQLLTTLDFVEFTSSPLLGTAATNKGLALFPRRIDGRFAALSRHDGRSNSVSFSDDIQRWPTSAPIECPVASWEAIQVGNCGPPIETEAGWLVLTHGVGPMRTYSIGAWLLDLHDPSKLIGRLPQPLLTPQADEQDGYVPNVVYSCGAMLHGDRLLIPYGIGDAAIGFATAQVGDVLAAMHVT